jgi:plasmid stabilization system protein ParE
MKVTWTNFALESLHEIYNYYKGNVNIRVANKIRADIFSAVKQLKVQPNSGAIEILLEPINEGHRCLIIGNYKIIYKVLKTNIYITDIFDTRQNPEKLVANNSSKFTLNEPNPEYQTYK